MLRINELTGFGSGGGHRVNAVTFDGTNDYLTKASDFTGNADSKLLTMSFWFRSNTGSGLRRLLEAGPERVYLEHTITETFRIHAKNSGGTKILQLETSAITDTNWHHYMLSVDMSDTGKRHLYIDDSSDLATVNTYTNDTIDFTESSWVVGARNGDFAVEWRGDFAEFWFDPGTYIDMSVAANRRKFISDSGKPESLGLTGQTPTGSDPLLFLSGETDDWHTNKGTGDGMTENGALTTASSSPSD